MHRVSRRRPWIGLSLLAIAGCASDGARPVNRVPGAVYHSRPDNFTVVVPPLLGPGIRASETATDATAAGVTFSDDFGTLLDVQSRHIGDEEIPGYVGPAKAGTLDAEFDGRVLPALRQRTPGATVLHRGRVDTSVGPAVFAVVSLPGGSARTLRDDAGRPYHPDAVRGVLVFQQLRWVYAVSVQQWPATTNGPKLSAVDRDARLLSDLRQAVAQMTFN